jgi:hypothetical protein
VLPRFHLVWFVALEVVLILVAFGVSQSVLAENAKLNNEEGLITAQVLKVHRHPGEPPCSEGGCEDGKYDVAFRAGSGPGMTATLASPGRYAVGDPVDLAVDAGPPVRVVFPSQVDQARNAIRFSRLGVIAGATAILMRYLVVAHRRRIARAPASGGSTPS